MKVYALKAFSLSPDGMKTVEVAAETVVDAPEALVESLKKSGLVRDLTAAEMKKDTPAGEKAKKPEKQDQA